MTANVAVAVLLLSFGEIAVAQNGNGNGPNKVPPDRMFFDSFLPGPLNVPWTAQRITPDSDLTVTRVFVTLKTPGAACTSPAVLRLASANGQIGEDLVLTPTGYDSGPQSMPFPASTQMELKVQAGGFCASGLQDANVAVQFRTGIAGDPTTCPASTLACNKFCCANGMPNSTTTCISNTCGLVCAGGFGNCDNNTANGCETDLNANLQNCGACGNICQGGSNATASCSNGTCGLTCSSGFADCNHNAADGCEINLLVNTLNCGACGKSCLPGQACTAGSCVNLP
jgi:hypothetical protein